MAHRAKPPYSGTNVVLINNPSNVAPLTTSTSTPTLEATAAALATETAARIAADAALTTTIAGLGGGGSIDFAALASGPSYADDAAAATGGIAVAHPYRNGNFICVRLS